MNKYNHTTKCSTLLRVLPHACSESRDFLKQMIRRNQDATIADAFEACDDATWLIWLADNFDVDAAILLDLIERLQASGVHLEMDVKQLDYVVEAYWWMTSEAGQYATVLQQLQQYPIDQNVLEITKKVLNLDTLIACANACKSGSAHEWGELQEGKDAELPF